MNADVGGTLNFGELKIFAQNAARVDVGGGRIGSPGRTRTADQRINSPSLYQLSYRGTEPLQAAAFWKMVPGKSRQRILNCVCTQ